MRSVWLRRQSSRLSYRVRSVRCNKWILSILLLCCILIFSFYAFNAALRPVIVSAGTTSALRAVEENVNRAVLSQLEESGVTYDDLVVLEKNEMGEIVAVKSNSVLMNLLKTKIGNGIIESVQNIDSREIGVPLGLLSGVEMLAGWGPRLPVTLVPYGTSSVDFESKFSAAGINQTKLQIDMVVKTKVGIMLPANSGTQLQEVESRFPIGETVIVGQIPDTYANFDRTSQPEDTAPLLQ